nr:protein rep [Priestia flexa]WEZ10432.1 protein rep [Priestia flexa]
MCNWRRSLKIAAQNKRIVETINERYKVRWLFLTLTVKNVNGDELRDTLTQMTDKFRRLMDYKPVKRSILGFFRGLEITYDYEQVITQKRYDKNPKYYKKQGLKPGDSNPNFGKYHPHFHVLICVKPSYFSMKEYCNVETSYEIGL